jgi:hypothetical protein
VPELPVRLDVRAPDEAAFCRFTINLNFYATPAAGESLVVFSDDAVALTVERIVHYPGPTPALLVLLRPTILESRDEVIALFDRFQSDYKVSELETDNKVPSAYYLLNLALVKLWGSRTFDLENDHPTAMAETVRGILMAARSATGQDPDEFRHQDEILGLHAQLINSKPGQNEPLLLLKLIRDWIPEIYRESWPGFDFGEIDKDEAVQNVSRNLSRIKSVPRDKWPACLGGRKDSL